jgi:ATP-dependent helicase/nuclease subunit A
VCVWGRVLLPDDLPMRALTDEQEQAVARRAGSLLLAAGAGSGKTSVLVERFVRAVREDGVAPGRILAITFTERAAGELRERVRARLLELSERDAAREAEGAFVSTFHGFCARLLRIHPLQAGLDPGFQILDEGLAGRLRLLAFSDALAGFLDGERPEAVDLVAAYGADRLRSMVFGAYAQLRSQGHSEPKLPLPGQRRRVVAGGQDGQERREGQGRGDGQEGPDGQQGSEGQDQRAARACALIGELMERFGGAYAQRKRARGALDFDDLELNARALLQRRGDVREAWSERFQMLMVDELQDTNPRQLEILAMLDRDNLFTVGDELQSIYLFRHADVGLFRERRARLAERGASLALTRNFRSRPAILAAVQRMFAQRMGERFAPLTAARAQDPSDGQPGGRAPGESGGEPLVELLLTDRRGWERVDGDEDVEELPDATPWRQAEARLLAGRIAELIDSGRARAGEVVVLLRALGDLPVYESALRHRGLRTLAGAGGFWSHQQVGDLLAWLRALANPLDEPALYSALASPLVGLSSDGLALVAHIAREQRHGVWQTVSEGAAELDGVLPPGDRERIVAFRELFAAERRTAALHPISELLRRVIAASGYEAHVLSLTWGERRLANVQKLVRLARRFEALQGRDLRGFLDHVAHVEGAMGGREADAPVADGELDAVRLMSIHAAKGLEFPVVCVADLGRAPNLTMGDLLVDALGGRMGLRLLDLGDPESAPALDFEELREERQAAQVEEEDRILYVAATRAEERLLLSGVVDFERWPQVKPGVAPIAWLAPALVPDAPRLAQDSESPADALTVDVGEGLLVRFALSAPGAEDESHIASIPQPLERASDRQVSAPALPREAPGTMPLVDPDGTMSYTSLAELERCGYRYYLERVLRLPENRAAGRSGKDDGGVQARTRGTIVHVLLESLDFARPKPPSAKDVARVARQIGATLNEGEREEIATLIATALQAEPARRLAVGRQARREHPFAFSLGPAHPGEPLVTGVLDLILSEPDGTTLIVDYKSDRLAEGEEEEELVQRDYGFQRLLYALAAIEDGAEEVEVAHWFLERPGHLVVARFAAGERDRLAELLLARVERERERGFAVAAVPHRGICLTCPGRGGLCSWGESHTLRERSSTLELDG